MQIVNSRATLGAFIFSIIVTHSAWSTASTAPEIAELEGTAANGEEIVLKGKNFTNKAHSRPLLFWSADEGSNPSKYGRKSNWENSFNGEILTAQQGAIVADGSKKSARIDYSQNSGAILGRVDVKSDQFYIWRKRYDDFDMIANKAIRTRFHTLTPLKVGATLSEGMLASSSDKKVWGQIVQVAGNTVYFSAKVGNIHDQAKAKTIRQDSLIYFYDKNDTKLSTPLLSAQSNESLGVYFTLNHKILRVYRNYNKSNSDSIHLSLDAQGALHGVEPGPFWRGKWLSKIDPATHRWVVEEFQYQTNTLDLQDGIFKFWQDRVPAWGENERFKFITSSNPTKLSEIFQTQVSNGAQPGTMEYFDSLYIDDSWHRVLICTEPTWNKCTKPEILIPVEWTDNRVKVIVRTGSLKGKGRYYFYIVNGRGEVNSKGFGSCPECPQPPFVQ